MDTKEKWKKTRNYPNYAVSNLGRVRRNKPGINTHVGKILKPYLTIHGYLCVMLYINKKRKVVTVHKLVTEAFIGPRPKNREVNHKDGIKTNNCWLNLEYTTKSENMKHAYKLGLMNRKGENHGRAKLKEKDVLKIRRLYKTGKYVQRELAEMFNIGIKSISDITLYKGWRHIK